MARINVSEIGRDLAAYAPYLCETELEKAVYYKHVNEFMAFVDMAVRKSKNVYVGQPWKPLEIFPEQPQQW